MENRKISPLSKFRFKQFSVAHEQSSMKVGTDAVLLGAWVADHEPSTVLDIGTGCGLIALMLAQRFGSAKIDAIDIDASSVEEAQANFKDSPWATRLHAYHCALQDWKTSGYDLIVCNPPYFAHSFPIAQKSRALARTQESLDFQTLIACAHRMLSPNGRLAVVIPAQFQEAFVMQLQQFSLQIARLATVLPFEDKTPVLALIEASVEKKETELESLTIRTQSGYHNDYLELTQAFYLFS